MAAASPVRVEVASTASAATVSADVLAIPVMAGGAADPVLTGLDPDAAAFAASREHAPTRWRRRVRRLDLSSV